MTNLKPVPKMQATGIGGIIAGLLVFVAKQAGVDVPLEVATGFVAVVMFAAGFFKKDKGAIA
jgi:hypothetical protein